MKKGVCILSGGLDSCVVAHIMKKELNLDLLCITFFYGQKHNQEILFAKNIAEELGAKWYQYTISLPKIVKENSSLTGSLHIPEGSYCEESMRSTVVPNRNTIMLSIAWSVLCAYDAEYLGCGVHAGDHFIYPDCRPEYIDSLRKTFKLGTFGHCSLDADIFTPFLFSNKSEIIKKGIELGIDFEKTWTCYKGLEMPCGKCGSCDERLKAFEALKLTDPMRYNDK